jgi:hypothetical protein
MHTKHDIFITFNNVGFSKLLNRAFNALKMAREIHSKIQCGFISESFIIGVFYEKFFP